MTLPPRRWTPVWATAVWAVWRRASWIRSPRCSTRPSATAFATITEFSRRSMGGDGGQREIASSWLRLRNVWETPRGNVRYIVRFGGRSEAPPGAQVQEPHRWVDTEDIYAIGFDQLIPGNRSPTVNHLRLWSGRAVTPFHIEAFNAGDYNAAVREQVDAKNLSRVLYPDDSTPQGKELRLKQQYFFVSASLQDMLATHLSEGRTLASMPEAIAIQMNDTHPALAVAGIDAAADRRARFDLGRKLADHDGRFRLHQSHLVARGARNLAGHPVRAVAAAASRNHLLDQPRFSAGRRGAPSERSAAGAAAFHHHRGRRAPGAHGALGGHRQPSRQRRGAAALRAHAQERIRRICRAVSGSIHQRDQRHFRAPLVEAVESRPRRRCSRSGWGTPGRTISRSSAD